MRRGVLNQHVWPYDRSAQQSQRIRGLSSAWIKHVAHLAPCMEKKGAGKSLTEQWSERDML